MLCVEPMVASRAVSSVAQPGGAIISDPRYDLSTWRFAS